MAITPRHVSDFVASLDKGADRDFSVMALLPMVRTIAKRIASKTETYGLDVDDLESEGAIGVMAAWDGFQSEYGVPFRNLALISAKRRMLNAIRRADPVPYTSRKLVRSAEDAMYARAQNEGSLPDANPAKEPPALRLARARAHAARVVRIDDPEFFDTTRDDEDPEERVIGSAERAAVRRALHGLPDRERHIVEQRVFERTLMRDLADEFGVSQQRIMQLHVAGVSRLRKTLAPVMAS